MRYPQQPVLDNEADVDSGSGGAAASPADLSAVGAHAGNAAMVRLLSAAGSGAGLPSEVRAEAEPRFGASFDDVRVHNDDAAARAAEAVSARAFTVGTNVYFGRGQYAPQSGAGRALLAHELTHVVQNRTSPAGPAMGGLVLSDPADAAEREAERASRAYTGSSGPVAVSGAANAVVHRQPDPGDASVAEPARPGGSLVRHLTGVTFTDDAGLVRAQLEDYVDGHGFESLAQFESSYELLTANGEVSLPEGGWPGGAGPAPADGDPEYLRRVIATVRTEIEKLRGDVTAFTADFQGRATEILNRLLADSERRVREQLVLYGITVDPTTVLGFTVWTSYTGVDNEQAKRLAADVKPLMAKVPAVRAAKAECETVTESSYKGTAAPSAAPSAVAAATEKYAAAQRDYDLARHQLETAHPVTQAYNLDAHRLETPLTLESLASDKPDERATVLGEELTTKLKNIDKVRAASVEDPEYVWTIAPLVGETLRHPGVTNNPFLANPGVQASVVEEKSADVKLVPELIAIGSGVVLLGLGLLAAIPTGGLSLEVTAGIGAAVVAGVALEGALFIEAYRRYDLASALAGTDYERARLLSHDAPELFWLALEMVGTVFAVAGGAKAVHQLFRKVVQLREEALIAKAMQQAAEATPASEPFPLTQPHNEPFPLTRPHQTEPPTLRNAEYQTESPTVRNAEYQTESPTLRNAEYQTESPTLRNAEYQTESPTLRNAEYQTESPTLGNAEPKKAEQTLPPTLEISERRVGIRPIEPAGPYRDKLDAVEKAANDAKPGSGSQVRAEVENAKPSPATHATPERGIDTASSAAGYHHRIFSQAEQELKQKWAELVAQGKKLTDFPRVGGLHANEAYLVTFKDGRSAIVKPNSGVTSQVYGKIPRGTVADREVAISELSEMYRFEKRVPITTKVDTDKGPAAMQDWVDDMKDADLERMKRAGQGPMYAEQEMEELAVLDYVGGNPDRNIGNWGTAPTGKLAGIDHGYAFPSPRTGYGIKSPFAYKYRGKKLSAETHAKVRAVHADELKAMLKARGLDESEIHAAVLRHKEIQDHGMITGEAHWEDRIDDFGYVTEGQAKR